MQLDVAVAVNQQVAVDVAVDVAAGDVVAAGVKAAAGVKPAVSAKAAAQARPTWHSDLATARAAPAHRSTALSPERLQALATPRSTRRSVSPFNAQSRRVVDADDVTGTRAAGCCLAPLFALLARLRLCCLLCSLSRRVVFRQVGHEPPRTHGRQRCFKHGYHSRSVDHDCG